MSSVTSDPDVRAAMSQMSRQVPAEEGPGSPGVEMISGLRIRSLRGVVITLAGQTLRLLLHLVSIAVLARVLTPRDFGLIAMVTAVTAFATMLRDMGLGTATIQRRNLSDGQVSALFLLNAGGSLAIAVVLAAFSPALAALYNDPRIVLITLAISPSIFVVGLSVQHRALLARDMRFFALVSIDVVSLASATTVAVISAVKGAGFWALVAIPLVQALVSTLLSWWLCSWRPHLVWNLNSVKSMMSFGGNVAVFNLMTYFTRNLDDILIGWRWGARPLGWYAKAYDLLLLPLRVINIPVSTVAVPLLSRLQDSPRDYRKVYITVLRNVSLLTMPFIAYMLIAGDWLIVSLLGTKWLPAAGIFRWLAAAAFVQVPSNTTGWLFITQDRTRELLRWGAFGSVTAVAAFIIGLQHGAYGVAVAYAITSTLIHTPILFWLVGRHGPIATSDLYRCTAAPSAMALAVSVALLMGRTLIDPSPAVGALGALGITIIVSLMVILAIPPTRLALVRDWGFLRSAWSSQTNGTRDTFDT